MHLVVIDKQLAESEVNWLSIAVFSHQDCTDLLLGSRQQQYNPKEG
jgi:hypothetical protein